ncbi:MAG TPA: hypothetical protein VFQ43_18310, partial [Nitrososphaera sp.]|nr:hypothetical protein [Nitrososphaera sp.]
KFSSVLVLLLTNTCYAQERPVVADQGTVDRGSTYRNATLGIAIALPGTGHIIGKATSSGSAAPQNHSKLSDCRGPLCGHPSIDVAIESPFRGSPGYAIFLAAYKLSGEYQDPMKHPLKDFANVMIVRNLGRLWITESRLTPMRLGGKPAFMLLAHNRKTPSAKAFMYVSKSSGYVFMLVATTVSAPEELRSAVENMQLVN